MTTLRCGDLLIGNSMSVLLTDTRIDGEYQNDATCTVTLKTSEGVVVSGANELAMEYVEDSDGEYEGILPHTLSLTVNSRYLVVVHAVATSGSVGHWEVEKVAKYRT